MPNGDCAVGARNAAEIANLKASVDLMRKDLRDLMEALGMEREQRKQGDHELRRALDSLTDWKRLAAAFIGIVGSSGLGAVVANWLTQCGR